MILAVDPGKIFGWAEYDRTRGLVRSGFARRAEDVPHAFFYETLVIEKPHGGDGAASKLDLVTLGRRLERIVSQGTYGKVLEVFPNRWKGQVRKHVMCERVRTWMTAEERELFEAQRFGSSIEHNVLDAIGIAIWFARAQGWRA